jgi:hypothetical protein
MFKIMTATGDVILDPINDTLRISLAHVREGERVRLTAEDARTLGSALIAFADRHGG